MPSSSKSPQAPSTKSLSFLRKSTDESPSKTTSTSVPSEVRTSQSTTSQSYMCVLWKYVGNYPFQTKDIVEKVKDISRYDLLKQFIENLEFTSILSQMRSKNF